MHIYQILVSSGSEDKFEATLNNFNVINSRKLATIIKKDEIVAQYQGGDNVGRNGI